MLFHKELLKVPFFTGSDRDYFKITSPRRDVAEDDYYEFWYTLAVINYFITTSTIVERRKNSIQILFPYLLWHIDVLQSLTDRSCAHALVYIG